MILLAPEFHGIVAHGAVEQSARCSRAESVEIRVVRRDPIKTIAGRRAITDGLENDSFLSFHGHLNRSVSQAHVHRQKRYVAETLAPQISGEGIYLLFMSRAHEQILRHVQIRVSFQQSSPRVRERFAGENYVTDRTSILDRLQRSIADHDRLMPHEHSYDLVLDATALVAYHADAIPVIEQTHRREIHAREDRRRVVVVVVHDVVPEK